jgi:hypothetical protein
MEEIKYEVIETDSNGSAGPGWFIAHIVGYWPKGYSKKLGVPWDEEEEKDHLEFVVETLNIGRDI